MDIAEKIKAAEAAGVSHLEIAERAGVYRSVVHRLSTGSRARTRFLDAAVSDAVDKSLRCLQLRKDAAAVMAAMTHDQRVEIADALGVAVPTIRNWAAGRGLPPWRRIGPILAAIKKVEKK